MGGIVQIKGLTKKLAMFMCIGALCVGSVFAAISDTEIYSWQSSADGPELVMSGDLGIYGENELSSTNDLYVEVYKVVAWYPDSCRFSTRVSEGEDTEYTLKSQSNGMYYIHLDPAGSFSTGCNGWGVVAG